MQEESKSLPFFFHFVNQTCVNPLTTFFALAGISRASLNFSNLLLFYCFFQQSSSKVLIIVKK